MSLSGHYWTVAPRFQALPPEPPAVPWSLTLDDLAVGPVKLSGRWSEVPGAQAAVLLVHGIAGCADARYARLGAAAALELGMSCLRLNLRGADRAGEDYYHAGLSSDLARVIESPELAGYERVHVMGYSLGGHLALRLAAVEAPPRLGAVAAVCAPLDLASCQVSFDRSGASVYRHFVLRGLKRIYTAVAERREVPIPVPAARRIRTIRQWDERVVAPRWGFAGADDYYAQASVAPHLPSLSVPALLVASQGDPMVPAATLTPVLARQSPERLTVRWLRGAGHLGFPEGQILDDLALPGIEWNDELEAGLDHQIVAWLRHNGR